MSYSGSNQPSSKQPSGLGKAIANDPRSNQTPRKPKYTPLNLNEIQKPIGASFWKQASFLDNTVPKQQTADEAYPTLPSQTITGPTSVGVPQVKSNMEKWVSTPVPQQEKVEKESDDLRDAKRALDEWDRVSHAGINVTLSENDVEKLANYAAGVKTKSKKNVAFNVLRGEGSGSYAAKDQLKVISIFSAALASATTDKQPTFHFTLK